MDGENEVTVEAQAPDSAAVRRALGEWRNCHVLLEWVARKQRRMRNVTKLRTWGFVRDYLLERRSEEATRAEKKLRREELTDYAALAQKLLGQPAEEAPDVLVARLSDSARRAWAKWQTALNRAQETHAISDLHAFRIATKALRYRVELLRDLGTKQLKADLKWLAALQDALGGWHDRQVLHHAVAEAMARPEVLLAELKTARLLLADLESDRARQSQDVEKIFHLAAGHPSRAAMESRFTLPPPVPPDPSHQAQELDVGKVAVNP